jgi:hypothetical protein
VIGILVAAGAVLPITNGTPSSDEAVVALAHEDVITCSGTVIAPQLVLTAAHCLSDSKLPDVAIDGTEHHPALAAFIHPQFDATTLDHDLALILVDPPLTVTPMPYVMTVDDLIVATQVRVVGYGFTVAGDTSPPMRLSGTSRIMSIDELQFTSTADPAQTCEGDSGGPALAQMIGPERIVGVASSGDATCTQFSKHTRVDVHYGYIADLVARTSAGGAAAGDRCWYPANCGAGTCTAALDDSRLSFCATTCDAGCAEGTSCSDGLCRHPTPSPGALGAPCNVDGDCVDALCVSPANVAQAVCTVRCFSDLPGFTCPSGTACGDAADTEQACFATTDGGGCSSTRADGGALLLLLLVGIRRRVIVNDPPAD